MHRVWLVFFALAVAFITIGFSGQRTFIYIGIAFLAIAMLRWVRRSS